MTPDAEERFDLPAPLELAATLWPLAHGTGDPTIRITADGVWRATRTDEGPATIHLRLDPSGLLHVEAWGAGARAAIAGAEELVGSWDEPAALAPQHPILRETMRRHPGLRLPRTRRLFEALLPAILEQKVTGVEARRAYRMLIRTYGEPAPGPPGLWLQPTPDLLRRLPYYRFHAAGLERRRAEVIRSAARLAARIESAPGPAAADRVMRSIGGIGPWTSAEVLRVAWGDPDAISIGDFHLPNLVAWALAGEARADDARMLELLEPYRGQRGRVQRLLELAGVRIPRFGARMPARSIAAI